MWHPGIQRFFKSTTVVLILLFLSSCGNTRQTTASTGRPPSFHHQRRLKYEHEALHPKPDALPADMEHLELESSAYTTALHAYIEDWEGTPHRMGGNTKKGVDCSGFVIRVYQDVYQMSFTGRRAEDLFSETTPLDKKELREGDLVFFKIHGRRIDHVGIYLSGGDFVHVSSSRGVMVSNLEEDYYQKRFFKGGRRNSS